MITKEIEFDVDVSKNIEDEHEYEHEHEQRENVHKLSDTFKKRFRDIARDMYRLSYI